MREYINPEGKQRTFTPEEGREESAKRRNFFDTIIMPAIQKELTKEELAQIDVQITGSTASNAAIQNSDLDIVVTNPRLMKLSLFVIALEKIEKLAEGRIYRVDIWPEYRDDEEEDLKQNRN